MEQEKAEVLKGTLDMLILKVVAFGPIHGYAISQRIQQISNYCFRVPGRFAIPRAAPTGRPRMAASEVGRNGLGRDAKFYTSPARGESSLARRWSIGSACRKRSR